MTDEEKKEKEMEEHILEEWKHLNEYISKIELDHTAKFAVLISGVLICLATIFNGNDIQKVFFYSFR